MNYLDDWLVLAWSEHKLCARRSMLLSHLELFGLRKESSVSQQASGFLGVVIDSTQMWAWLSLESSQRTLGLMASTVIPLGLLHM